MSNGEGQQSTIGEDVEVVGSIKCAGSIQIDGKLNGDLSCNGSAVIGDKATIKGNMTVESVTIMGQVNGNVTARDRIELKSTTRLNGDIRAKRLTVEDGVTFVGKSEVNPSGTEGRRATQGDSKTDASKSAPPQEKTQAKPQENTQEKTQAKPQGEASADDKGKGGFFGKK